MSESALLAWLLSIGGGVWAGALIAALTFPVIDTWRTQHRIHASGTVLMVVLAISIGAGFWIDATARWLLLSSAVLGFASIALPVLRLERG